MGELGRRSALLSCLALALAAAPAAQAREVPRALIAFVPSAEPLSLLGQPALADLPLGLVSPTVGGYRPGQMTLDVGQGARISTRVYPRRLSRLRLVAEGRGARIAGWEAAVERAEDAPGDIVPGLLADSVRRAGGRVAYAGPAGAAQVEAAAAADRGGRIERVAIAAPARVGAAAAALWRDSALVVARLPRGSAGPAQLERLLAERRASDLVVVLRAPPSGKRRLLPAAAAGLGRGGLLRSPTTRRAGLVAATDIAPAVLERLDVDVPDEIDGRALETTGERGRPGAAAAELRELSDRLGAIPGRRGPAVLLAAACALLLAGLLAAAGGRGGGRAGLRAAFLAALWLPGVALVCAALEPTAAVEVAALAGGSLALGLLTDRLMPWPLAPAVPAALVALAHGADLIAGSPLIARALTGPNPGAGARYYGIGNELEVLLSTAVLIGAGAALTRARPRQAPWGFAVAGLVAGAAMAAGRLGADVGAALTLGAGTATAVVLALPGGPTRRAIALAVAAPVAALLALVAVDLATGGDAHLTRSVVEADSPGDLLDVAERRFRLSTGALGSAGTAIAVAVALVALVAGFLGRRRLLAPLRWAPGHGGAFSAGLGGAFAAVIAGALANDSGPLVVMVGTVVLWLAAGYAAAGPPERGTAGSSSTMARCA